MKSLIRPLAIFAVLAHLLTPSTSAAQSAPTVTAPAYVRLDGELKTSTGEPLSGTVALQITLYAGEFDTNPVWSETQAVTLDAAGRYGVLVGATRPDGIPREAIVSGGAQWIGIGVGGVEQPRVRMLSVPYAVSAANADTLGGIPATNFVMTENLRESVEAALGTDGPAIKGVASDPTIMGSSGRIPKFDATGLAANIVDSVMFESAGKIGIGTTNPGAGLDIFSTPIRVNSNGNAVGAFIDGLNMGSWDMFGYPLAATSEIAIGGYRASQWNALRFYTSGTEKVRLTSAGRLGIGTSAPSALVDVANGPIAVNSNGIPVASFVDGLKMGGWDMFGYEAVPGNAVAVGGYRAGQWSGVALFTSGAERVRVDGSGNLGIGTTSPVAKLHVVGTAYVTGNVTVDGNIGAKYQDVAEWVETGEPLEAGTVVIVAAGMTDQVEPSQIAYDTRVAGAVSKQPGLILGVAGDSKSLVAQSGRVRIKVDASYGAIKAGDLLVTSPTPGHAMLSKPIKVGREKFHRPGTLVGKALEGLANGKGEILVLLTLQ